MTPAQLNRREALLARNDAALAAWPERTGAAFSAEMGALAEGFEALARAADRTGGDDALERARTWRFAGNAYFDLGAGREPAALERAAQAYHSAEGLLAGLDDSMETVKLNYCYGNALMKLSSGHDAALPARAHEHFTKALRLAREHMPDAVGPLQRELRDAARILALSKQAAGLGQRIDQLKQQVQSMDRKAQHQAEAEDMAGLFGILQQQFEQAKPTLAPNRQASLGDLMQSFAGVVQQGTSAKRSLEDALANRGKLDGLVRQIYAQVKKPSLPGAGTAAGARGEALLAQLQELKMSVAGSALAPGMPSGMREAGMDLFLRIARLTTRVSQAGEDAAGLRQIECDDARGLAHEVRLHARRAHLMLARPLWPSGDAAVDPNRVFFAGGAPVLAALEAAAKPLAVELFPPAAAGAEYAAQRWQDLRTANLAVFDLGGAQPQVYYELGIALSLGTQLLLLAPEDSALPFDVAQHVCRYSAHIDLPDLLARELDAALYALHVRSGGASGIAATLAFAEQLARAAPERALLGAALNALRGAGADPVKFHDALTAFNSSLGRAERQIIYPRWPASYPDASQPRCFAVMPFRPAQEPAYAVMAEVAHKSGIEPVRGDVAEGQQIIESIWEEICRATHISVDLSGFNRNVCLELGIAHTLGRPTLLIGAEGTERELQAALPSVAKWRCHTYAADARSKPSFATALRKFFANHRVPL